MKKELLIAALLLTALVIGPFTPVAGSETEQETFTQEQYSWAIDWINGPLETLMAHGVIESIASAGTDFQVRAGASWKRLSFKQTGELLAKFSRARQIIGHSPFFTVEEASTGEVIGRVTQASITILLSGEGYFKYFPDTNTLENTAY